MNPKHSALLASTLCLFFEMMPNLEAADNSLHLTLRSRVKTGDGANAAYQVVEKAVTWDPKQTALIICDM